MIQLIGRLPSIEGASVDHDHELQLLELQLNECGLEGSASPSKCLTYPRKRRAAKSLMTLWSQRDLLDCNHVSTQHLLSNININWDFNAFSFDRLTDGQNLATLCTYLFQELGLCRHFGLDSLLVWKFFSSIEQHYHWGNPYHNGVHAADVTQAMACFIQESIFRQHLSPLEKMAALIAAVAHDVDHPGLNEKFLVTTSSHLAGLYHNSSVLENHHWRTCVALMREAGLSACLSSADLTELQGLIQAMILATDISRQADFLSRLGQFLDSGSMDMSSHLHRHFMLQIALKCADISNPCRTWNISRLWSYRACEEFYRQGDRERELNFPVTPLFDRNAISVAKVQSLFYRNIATPLFEEWQRCLNTSLSASMMSNLSSNQARWDLICQQEARIAGMMAESIVSTSSSSGGGLNPESRRDSLEPPLPNYRFNSRSSGPATETSEGGSEDSDQSCSPYPYMPLDSVETSSDLPASWSSLSWHRRHSLPPPPLPILDTSSSSKDQRLQIELEQKLSLIEKRRSVQELRRQNNELLANLKVNKRRRIFANSNAKGQSAEGPKVTFHFLDEACRLPVKDAEYHHRRGSAPSTLLLNQINKIANTAVKAAMQAGSSREASPRERVNPAGLRSSHRRSSLPLTDSMELAATDKSSRSLSREKVIKKRKLLRRRSAGSGDYDYYPASLSGSKRMIHRMTNPSLSSSSSSAVACLAFRRGSLKSSSFGGVGSTISVGSSSTSAKLLKKNHHLLLRNWQEEQQENIHSNNGRRRGSLPLELILC